MELDLFFPADHRLPKLLPPGTRIVVPDTALTIIAGEGGMELMQNQLNGHEYFGYAWRHHGRKCTCDGKSEQCPTDCKCCSGSNLSVHKKFVQWHDLPPYLETSVCLFCEDTFSQSGYDGYVEEGMHRHCRTILTRRWMAATETVSVRTCCRCGDTYKLFRYPQVDRLCSICAGLIELYLGTPR